MGRQKRRLITLADRVVIERFLLFSELGGADLLRMLLTRLGRADPLSSSSTYKRQYDAVSRRALQTPQQRAHAVEGLRQLERSPAPLVQKSVSAVTFLLGALSRACTWRRLNLDDTKTTARGLEAIGRDYSDANAAFLFHAELMQSALHARQRLQAIAAPDPAADGLRELVESACYGLSLIVMNVLHGRWTVFQCGKCERFIVKDTDHVHKYCGPRCKNAQRNDERDPEKRRREEKRALDASRALRGN